MALKLWLHEWGSDLILFYKGTRREKKERLRALLRQGVHPFFLTSLLSIIPQGQDREEEEVGGGVNALQRGLMEDESKRLDNVPDPWASGLERSPSRLYEDAWSKPRRGLDSGIFYGAFVEFIREAARCNQAEDDTWVKMQIEHAANRFLSHPEADLGFVVFFKSLGSPLDRKTGQPLTNTLAHKYAGKLLKELGVERVALTLLELWAKEGALDLYSLIPDVCGAVEDFSPKLTSGLTRFLAAILDAAQDEQNPLSKPAKIFLSIHPALLQGKDKNRRNEVGEARNLLIGEIKEELPNLRTFHTIARWLQEVPAECRPTDILELLITWDTEGGSGFHVDTRLEYLIEDLLGKEGWKELCDLLEEHFQTRCSVDEGGQSLSQGAVDESTSAYRSFADKVKQARLVNHDGRLAEAVDISIAASGISFRKAQEVAEETINLLAGDTVLTVTNLPKHWLAVRRRHDEFLGEQFSMIEVAEHPILGDNGAACRFWIVVSELPDKPLTGTLDQEGRISFDQISVLTGLGRRALQAVVVQTLAAVLVPQYLYSIAPRHKKGGGLTYTGEFWAHRPAVHTQGDLSGEPEEIEDGPSVVRINPGVALELFQWLIGDRPDLPRRLHRLVLEGKEAYYPTWKDAYKLLVERRAGLSEVYFRTVRVHTKPAGVYRRQGSDTIVVRQKSEAAQLKYEHYRADGGRELSFFDEWITYKLDETRRIVLKVPRTFNYGTYHSLEQIWVEVPNHSLKVRAREAFKF